MTIKTDLQHFYDYEAKKYYETRKKFRKEGERILEILHQRTSAHPGEKISILEFWSGSGRLTSYLSEHFTEKFSYVGVDFSKALINYAKQDNPKMKFIHEDITEFIVRQKQETFHIVIGTASFQHIPSFRERLFLMKHFYRILHYDGLLIMTNRSYSYRFLKRFRKEMLLSLGKRLITLGKTSRRDIFLPRTSRGKTKKRYYHIFNLKELKKLTDFSGLKEESLHYLDDQGHQTLDRRQAKNSLLVAKKTPIE